MQQPDIYSPELVKGIFDRCSGRYITFSLLCSLGFTERWRKQCIDMLPSRLADGARGYDLMAGTGEVWPHLLRRFPAIDAITAVDISSGMHRRALDRLHAHRAQRIEFLERDVLTGELPAASADFVVSTFGLKTFNALQQSQLAAMIARILRPGAGFSLIEASDPRGWWLRPLYLLHLKVVLPLIERVVLRGAQDFAMIGTYSTNFGNAAAFGEMLRAEGLRVQFNRHFFGCATSVSGTKPREPGLSKGDGDDG